MEHELRALVGGGGTPRAQHVPSAMKAGSQSPKMNADASRSPARKRGSSLRNPNLLSSTPTNKEAVVPGISQISTGSLWTQPSTESPLESETPTPSSSSSRTPIHAGENDTSLPGNVLASPRVNISNPAPRKTSQSRSQIPENSAPSTSPPKTERAEQGRKASDTTAPSPNSSSPSSRNSIRINTASPAATCTTNTHVTATTNFRNFSLDSSTSRSPTSTRTCTRNDQVPNSLLRHGRTISDSLNSKKSPKPSNHRPPNDPLSKTISHSKSEFGFKQNRQWMAPPPPLASSLKVDHIGSRDTYGFKKASAFVTLEIYEKFERRYVKIQERQRERWDRVFSQKHSKSSLAGGSMGLSGQKQGAPATNQAHSQHRLSVSSTSTGGDVKFELDANNQPKPSPEVKRYIRKGIPNTYRRRCWLHYSGAAEKMKRWPGVYQKLVAKEQEILNERRRGGSLLDKDGNIAPINEHVDIIERDINRTFPTNYHFQPMIGTPKFGEDFPSPPFQYSQPLLPALRRVLVGYSFYNPVIGYCQSMNYIVGLLLLFMPEEEAFWMLVTITQDILPPGVYTRSMAGTIQETRVLKSIAREKCAGVVDKVDQGGIIELEMLISPWFLTLYIHVLPIETVLRVWDCLFYEGSKILYRVALAILKRHENQIMKIKDPMEVVQFIQNCPKKEVNCHKLLKIAFGRFGHNAIGYLAERDIRRKRANVQREML